MSDTTFSTAECGDYYVYTDEDGEPVVFCADGGDPDDNDDVPFHQLTEAEKHAVLVARSEDDLLRLWAIMVSGARKLARTGEIPDEETLFPRYYFGDGILGTWRKPLPDCLGVQSSPGDVASLMDVMTAAFRVGVYEELTAASLGVDVESLVKVTSAYSAPVLVEMLTEWAMAL